MKEGTHFHHTVAIAGVVRDGVSQARIAHALVEIISGPPKFRAKVQALAADSAWLRRPERIDRTWSQADGIFTFVDLPLGQYRLRVSVVELSPADYRLCGSLVTTPPDDYRRRVDERDLGTRYGTVEIGPIQTHAHKKGQPVPVARADVALPPTRIHGVVTHQVTGDPVSGARVRLRGDTQVVVTTDAGLYELTRLVKGAPNLEVSAANFVTFVKKVELAPGQDRTEDIPLAPG